VKKGIVWFEPVHSCMLFVYKVHASVEAIATFHAWHACEFYHGQ